MNHSWKHSGPQAVAVQRVCSLCSAQGSRLRTAGGFTRWETQLAAGAPWVSGRIPPCPAARAGSSRYTPVSILLLARLRAEAIVPQDAEVHMEHLPGDWRQRSSPEHPAWQATWPGPPGTHVKVWSCWSMRRVAEAPALVLEAGEITPARTAGEP